MPTTKAPIATASPGAKLLTPSDHTLVMIDFQSQMAFATHSIDPVQLRSNAALVASAAAGFGACSSHWTAPTRPPARSRSGTASSPTSATTTR